MEKTTPKTCDGDKKKRIISIFFFEYKKNKDLLQQQPEI